jgi:hypothetical protein
MLGLATPAPAASEVIYPDPNLPFCSRSKDLIVGRFVQATERRVDLEIGGVVRLVELAPQCALSTDHPGASLSDFWVGERLAAEGTDKADAFEATAVGSVYTALTTVVTGIGRDVIETQAGSVNITPNSQLKGVDIGRKVLLSVRINPETGTMNAVNGFSTD